jgi:cell division protein FtsB
VATAAQHARRAPAPRHRDDARPDAPVYAYRAPRTRRRAAQRSRLTRAFVIFVACLTVLAVGRVALSFAVVQKSLQTDAVVHEARRVAARNDERQEELARLSSPARIRHIAEKELGLVFPTHVEYPEPLMHGTVVEVAANR